MCDEIQGFYFYKPMMPDEIENTFITKLQLTN